MRRNSTTRVLSAIGLALSAMLALGAPAAAQYGDDPSVRERVGNVTPEQAAPGTPVVFTTDPVFEPGSTVQVFLVRALQGATPTPVGPASVVVTANGSITAAFTIPPGTPVGIYFVYATGTGDDDEDLRVVGVVIVRAGATSASLTPLAGGGGAASGPAPAAAGAAGIGEGGSASDDVAAGDGGSGESATTPSAGSVATPAEIQAIQYPADVEQVLYDEAVASGESVDLDANGLVLAGGVGGVGGEAAAGGDSAPAPIAAALVAGVFVAGGLFALRRRQQHAS